MLDLGSLVELGTSTLDLCFSPSCVGCKNSKFPSVLI